ncbi:MAG: hypothetical protein R2754_00125 [Microthrixaceae bacterium]
MSAATEHTTTEVATNAFTIIHRLMTIKRAPDGYSGCCEDGSIRDAELVGFIATPEGVPEGSWEFFYDGDADPADYPDARPVYAPIATITNQGETE